MDPDQCRCGRTFVLGQNFVFKGINGMLKHPSNVIAGRQTCEGDEWLVLPAMRLLFAPSVSDNPFELIDFDQQKCTAWLAV